jgi:hypothetical protein
MDLEEHGIQILFFLSFNIAFRGVIAVGLFATKNNLIAAYGKDSDLDVYGLFTGVI